jgi:hypothetical protein
MIHYFGNNAGEAFAFAFKCIVKDGKRAKLSKEAGQWFVTVNESK